MPLKRGLAVTNFAFQTEVTLQIILLVNYHGPRTTQALEALKRSQALDAFQDGRHLGTPAFPGPSQAERVPAPTLDPEEQTKVRPHWQGIQDDLHGEARHSRRQGQNW